MQAKTGFALTGLIMVLSFIGDALHHTHANAPQIWMIFGGWLAYGMIKLSAVK